MMQLPAASGPQQSSPEPVRAARSCVRAASSETRGRWINGLLCCCLESCVAPGGHAIPSVSLPRLYVVENGRTCFSSPPVQSQ